MAFIATKPCKFAGQTFRIGEAIPAEAIQPGSVRNLVKMGIIAEGEPEEMTPQEGETTIAITIHEKEGDLPLELTSEGLQSVFDVLTSTVGDAETIINEMTDGDALILLNAADSRKSVKELAETRAKAMIAAEDAVEGDESEGEQ